MTDESSHDDKPADRPEYEPPRGAETTATWGAGDTTIEYTASAGWLVLRKKDKPSAEIFSVSYVAAGRGRRAAGHVRLQRRAGRLVGVPPPGRCGAAAGGVPGRRDAADDAAAARRERRVLARVHRPRLRRPGRDGLQPGDRARRQGGRDGKGAGDDKEQARQGRRRDRPQGVLRLPARPRVAVRVHGPLAVEPRPLGLADLHRRRELRRATASGGSCACSRRRPGSGSTARS